MMIRILLYLAIVIQLIAMYFAIRMVRVTKYNSIWILFFVGFTVLAVQRVLQLWMNYGHPMPVITMVWFDIAVSFCISVGMVFLHRLFVYIDRLNRHRQLTDKRILTAVLRTEERSRADFSRELHDGLGPLLSSAKMSLSALSTEKCGDSRTLIDNTMYVIDEAIRSLREISNNLSPHVLNNFGLARGIQNFIDKSCAMHSTAIEFKTNLRTERFDSNIEVILYRVVCELINNSLKHSGCSRIELALILCGDVLQLDFTDNGRGFSPREMIDCGMGLSNINSRIGSLNGSFDIESRDGEGMHARVKVNIDSAIILTVPRRRDKIKNRK